MSFSAHDEQMMRRALRLADRGRNSVSPNPAVGCVIADATGVVGEGYHERAGDAHAEVNALRAAAGAASGATAFVTLEPCNTHGRTPPCVDALIAAGVQRVVFAMQDPNPAVSGNGAQRLRDAGILVEHGLMHDAAQALNPGYIMRMQANNPRVTLKIAASLDGATAMGTGESQWITGDAARRDVQRLRAASCAVMTGIGTVLADDPSLNVRGDGLGNLGRQPMRVVLDTALRMPSRARMFALEGQTLIMTAATDIARLAEAGVSVTRLTTDAQGQLDLAQVMRALAERGVNEVLVEAGRTLCGSLLAAQLVDRIVLYMAPKLLGSETQGLIRTPNWITLAQGQSLAIEDVRRVGDDLRIIAMPISG
ncbi:MAG: bifunctional diaminohydroxyphosphoribosylaminopyrimidine deaminase/5-amino-6-(5-phosphoribosylamino)uracil reductase RibD [Pseudomonadota bacterium]